ncbi:MAG: aspartate kinase, partial [Myxococcota bacterium]
MALIVQKFGGSSVGSIDRIQHVADRVAGRAQGGDSLVVVVSAMRGETDRLYGLAHQVTDEPAPREVDALMSTGEQVSAALLAIALKSRGVAARSMSGAQMGIETDGVFSRARIRTMNRARVDAALERGEVVVATGFQGIDRDGNVTTLGRGGSDTSAVAMAAALEADECEIYTDVLGVYTADPNLCPDASKLEVIAFEEMMEMASQGSKVLQIRSVELAMNHRVPLRVRSTFSDDPGTLVTEESEDIERLVVRGVSHNSNEIKVTVRAVPDTPGVASKLFTALAEAAINVDVIVQNKSLEGITDLSFTVERTDQTQTERIALEFNSEVGGGGVEVDPNIAKVSVVGVGMRAHPGVAAATFRALSDADVNIQMISTSEIKITCVVSQSEVAAAAQALHRTFELHRGGIRAKAEPASKRAASGSAKSRSAKSTTSGRSKKTRTKKKTSKKKTSVTRRAS